MKTNLFAKPVLLIAIAGIVGSGCVVREVRYRNPPPPPGEVVVTDAPPPPQVEYQTVAPAPDFIWIGGAWVWEGRWVWHGGHWDRPPHPGARWYPDRYVFRGGHRVFVRGYWR